MDVEDEKMEEVKTGDERDVMVGLKMEVVVVVARIGKVVKHDDLTLAIRCMYGLMLDVIREDSENEGDAN